MVYHIIGSYVHNNSNQQILENIRWHLQDGGIALISVMNYELTKRKAIHRFHMKKTPNELLKLKSSAIQDRTGDVFDPKYYLLDISDPGVIYRREQLKRGSALPIELIVRDRRFTAAEISDMCALAGLDVLFSRFVNSGHWEISRGRTEDHAKEILLKCRTEKAVRETPYRQ